MSEARAGTGPDIAPLDPAQDPAAAPILAAATGAGSGERAAALLAALRADPAAMVYGLTVDGRLVAVYATREAPMSLEVTHLAVAAGHRRRGYGRLCLTDALRRAGRRPLVVETDDAALGFYRACGFKLIGRRKHPAGPTRYRLGWHAPAPAARATR